MDRLIKTEARLISVVGSLTVAEIVEYLVLDYVSANEPALELLAAHDYLPGDLICNELNSQNTMPHYDGESTAFINLGRHAVPSGQGVCSRTYLPGEGTIRGLLTVGGMADTLNENNLHGNTALHLFVLSDDILSTFWLLEFQERTASFDLEINQSNNAGYTPLMLAVVKSPIIAMLLLSRQSIDINIGDGSGFTSRDYAKSRLLLHKEKIHEERWNGSICETLSMPQQGVKVTQQLLTYLFSQSIRPLQSQLYIAHLSRHFGHTA